MRRLLARALLVLAAACTWPGAASAQEPPGQETADVQTGAAAEAARHVAEGRRLYTELDFAASVEAMRRALAVPGIPDALRLEALEYIGSSYVVLERPDEAREAFEAMLALDPYHVVREPSGSPKIASFVEQVRATVVGDAALDPDVRLRPQLPRAGRVGRDTPIRFDVEGPPRVERLTVFVRGVGDPGYQPVEAEPDDGSFVVHVPARDAPDELELYAQGRDADDRVVSRAGEPLAPLTLPIRASGEPRATSLLERWWFWTAVGAVVVGGLVLGLTLGGGDQAPAGTLPPGRVELP